ASGDRTLEALFRGIGRGLVDPAGLDARLEDHRPALFAREAESTERARMAPRGATDRLDPAMKIVDVASGELFQRLDTVLAQGDQHRRRATGNLLESVVDAERLALDFEFGFVAAGRRGRRSLRRLRAQLGLRSLCRFGGASQPGEHVPPVSLWSPTRGS